MRKYKQLINEGAIMKKHVIEGKIILELGEAGQGPYGIEIHKKGKKPVYLDCFLNELVTEDWAYGSKILPGTYRITIERTDSEMASEEI